MRINISLAALAAALAATPALASEDNPQFGGMISIPPMSEVAAVEKGALIATPILDIKFDLANVGKTESTPQPKIGEKDDEPTEEGADTDPLITGGAAIDSKYVFSDLYVQTDSPTAKVYASVSLRDLGLKACTADFFAAHGIKKKVGREFDFGASCGIPLADGIEASLGVSRYVLGGLTDITTLEGTVKVGAFDVVVDQYVVDGAEADATKVEVGYTLTPIKALSLRMLGVYENGFGLPDLFAAGVEASYSLTKRLSLTGAIYAPISGAGPRKTQAVAGISFNF